MQRDYILRQIEILGAILRRIRQRILGGATGEAASELAQAATQVGVDFVMAQRLSAESLVALLSVGAEPDVARCLLYAEVLYVDGLRAEAEGAEPEARASFGKALLLFETARTVSPVVITTETEAKISELAQRLATPPPRNA